MIGEEPVPPEKWPHNFRELPEKASPWDVALMWIAEGLLEWGNDTADTEQILLAAYEHRLSGAPAPEPVDPFAQRKTEQR